jgi:histidinol-phosphatase (PHP family)
MTKAPPDAGRQPRAQPVVVGRADRVDGGEYRHVLRTLASTGKALEVSTRVPLRPQILTWWRQEGGQAITFASDAHDPAAFATGFAEAAHMADAAGFAAGRDPGDFWGRKTSLG